MPADLPFPRNPLATLIEDLREEAVDIGGALEGIPPHETVYGEAAQALEEFEAALTQIADGADDPQAVAREALSLAMPLKPIGSAEDSIRALLKPRPG